MTNTAPGEILAQEFLKPMAITQYQFGARLKKEVKILAAALALRREHHSIDLIFNSALKA